MFNELRASLYDHFYDLWDDSRAQLIYERAEVETTAPPIVRLLLSGNDPFFEDDVTGGRATQTGILTIFGHLDTDETLIVMTETLDYAKEILEGFGFKAEKLEDLFWDPWNDGHNSPEDPAFFTRKVTKRFTLKYRL